MMKVPEDSHDKTQEDWTRIDEEEDWVRAVEEEDLTRAVDEEEDLSRAVEEAVHDLPAGLTRGGDTYLQLQPLSARHR